MHPDVLTADDTMTVTHQYDQIELIITLKLFGIISSSLILFGLVITILGIYMYLCITRRKKSLLCLAMIIGETKNCLEEEKEIKMDVIKKFLKILLVLLILFTIIYFTCFGCLLVLNNSSSLVAQIVTLSSEGGANETYPDSMGEYQLAGEDISGYTWYQNKDREDRFLLYNGQGNIEFCL